MQRFAQLRWQGALDIGIIAFVVYRLSDMIKGTRAMQQVYLDLKGLGLGRHTVPLRLELPAQIKVLEQKPTRFSVRILTPKG